MSPRTLHFCFFSLLAMAASACKSNAPNVQPANDELSKPALDVPSPPADGPKLVIVRPNTPIVTQPTENAKKIGELNAGALIPRSKTPHGHAGCPGGWYAVRPKGFVCAGEAASLQEELAKVLPAPPDLARPLPYRYGRTRTQGSPLYSFIPGRSALNDAEPDLSRHLDKVAHDAEDILGASANDIPLDERGVATGPPILLPTGDGVGPDGRRSEATFFAFPQAAPMPLVSLSLLGGDLSTKVAALRKGSGVAITGAFSTPDDAQRHFGITPAGKLIPTDRLQAALGSTWHGIDLSKIGLPVAFVHKYDVKTWTIDHRKPVENDEELERHAAIPLTGRFRTVDGVRYEEAQEGFWLRSQDLIMIMRRTKFPEFAKGTQKWLDISLANQTLTAYEGQKPVYATLISSGRDQLGDPATSASTMRGNFRILGKRVTADIDSKETQDAFDVFDAPWVMDFEAGHAITGMYWSDKVGEAHGFHNVAMTPVDARRVWNWVDPPLPDGWHAVVSSDDEGTWVSIRP